MTQTNCIEGVLQNGVVLLEELLTIQKVTKNFRDRNGSLVQVLTDVSLTIRDIQDKPQIISILGPSGSGKTSLLRIIAGLDKPDAGFVKLYNEKDGMRSVRAGDVGLVFQSYPLFEDRTVLKNLTEPARNGGLSKSEADEKVRAFLAEFGLSEHGGFYPAQLSGGQRQRVAIAQQLIQERFYIALDEPFSGLDPNNIANVIKLLSSVAHRHTKNTFIVVTHDITSALIISDRVILLGKPLDSDNEGGRIVKDYNLIEEGLAYRPDIEDLPRFSEIRKEIKYTEFPKLDTRKSLPG
jgi:NitT/TauT family transport system ATP-binding protein